MNRKILLVLFLVLLAVLLVPVPHYNKYDADCLPCPPTDDCPPCPRKGWEFKKPILLQLISILGSQQVSEVGETQLPQSTVFEDDCDKLEEQIYELLRKANHCRKDSDCKLADISSGCPIGCFNLVSGKEDLSVVREGVGKYRKECPPCLVQLECNIPPGSREIECRNGKCIDVRYE